MERADDCVTLTLGLLRIREGHAVYDTELGLVGPLNVMSSALRPIGPLVDGFLAVTASVGLLDSVGPLSEGPLLVEHLVAGSAAFGPDEPLPFVPLEAPIPGGLSVGE